VEVYVSGLNGWTFIGLVLAKEMRESGEIR
jgi:hypothetical protein